MANKAEMIAGQMAAGASIANIWGTLVYNVKDIAYGAKANGSDDAASIQKAINAASVTGGHVIFPPGTYVTGNFTAPSNVTLVFLNGAKLSINNGMTVTINGPLQAGVHQIFSGMGTVVFNQAVTTVGYPEWWGAITNDGNVDCLVAISACIVALPVTQLQRADYFISDTLKIQTPHRTIQGVDIHWYDETSNKATRIIVKSSTADTILVGYMNNPGAVNDFLQQAIIRRLDATRDRAVTPPAAGQEITGAAGIRIQFTLDASVEKVRSEEHTLGFCLNGTVHTKLEDCYAFRSSVGTTSNNDVFYGFFQNGNVEIGLAGGNASTYYTDCNVTIGGNIPLTDSIGFNLSGKPVDTFMLRPETSATNTGIQLSGDTSIDGNADIHIIGATIDQFGLHGIYLTGIGDYGAIDITGSYFAPKGGSFTGYGIRTLNYTGMLTLTGNQVVSYQNNLVIGLWVESSSGVQSRNNMYLGEFRPVVLLNASNCVIQDIMNNPGQTATEAAVVLDGVSERNYIAPNVKGKVDAFPYGVNLKNASNNYNEINCSGIKASTVNGGSGNKLVINGAQVTTTGLAGTNLVSGVMA